MITCKAKNEECKKPATRRGLCDRHYQQAKRGVIPMPGGLNVPKCSAQPCENPARTRGICVNHYQQALRGVIPMPPRRTRENVVACNVTLAKPDDDTLRELALRFEMPRQAMATRLLESGIRKLAAKSAAAK